MRKNEAENYFEYYSFSKEGEEDDFRKIFSSKLLLLLNYL